MDGITIIHPDKLRDLVRTTVQDALREALPDVLREASAKPYLTRKELEELTGLSTRAIAYRKAKGEIPYVQHGRKVLYPRAAIMKWLEQGRVPSRSPRSS